jgi:hypothetical protein
MNLKIISQATSAHVIETKCDWLARHTQISNLDILTLEGYSTSTISIKKLYLWTLTR